VITTAEVARVLNVPERRELSERDREFVRDELGWIAEWIRKRYPEMSYRQIKRVIRDILEVTI